MTKDVNRESTNKAVYVLSTITKYVMTSAPEAATGALYYGRKRTIPYRMKFEEMGHPQTKSTQVTTDNSIFRHVLQGVNTQ